MSTSWTRTREQLGDMIGRKLGVKDQGQTLSAEDAEIILESIDLRLKELHRLGVLWFNVAGGATSVVTTAGDATSDISAVTDFLFPVSLMLDGTGDQSPIQIIGHLEYQAITNKTEQGEPVYAYFSGSSVYLWPVPNATGTMKMTYQAIATDSTTGAQPDVQIDMLRSLALLCASDLVLDFQVPAQTAQIIMGQAGQAMKDIRALAAQRVDTGVVAPESF